MHDRVHERLAQSQRRQRRQIAPPLSLKTHQQASVARHEGQRLRNGQGWIGIKPSAVDQLAAGPPREARQLQVGVGEPDQPLATEKEQTTNARNPVPPLHLQHPQRLKIAGTQVALLGECLTHRGEVEGVALEVDQRLLVEARSPDRPGEFRD